MADHSELTPEEWAMAQFLKPADATFKRVWKDDEGIHIELLYPSNS